MNVCIIEHANLRRFPKRYQIMKPVKCGFLQVHRELLTLDDARTICSGEGYNVLAIGDFYQCHGPWND